MLAECAPQAAKYGKCVGDSLGKNNFISKAAYIKFESVLIYLGKYFCKILENYGCANL